MVGHKDVWFSTGISIKHDFRALFLWGKNGSSHRKKQKKEPTPLARDEALVLFEF